MTDTTDPDQLRADAWSRFESNDFDAAAAAFRRLVTLVGADDDSLAALSQIALDTGGPTSAIDLIADALDDPRTHLLPHQRLIWSIDVFDAARTGQRAIDAGQCALHLLEAAAADEGEGWTIVLTDERRQAIDAAMADPSLALQILEQFTFAPGETGLPAQAAGRIESLGLLTPTASIARAAERLLHNLGDPNAAYRVETHRRDLVRPATGQAVEPVLSTPSLRGLTVAIAGGHPPLRTLVRRDLERAGVVDLREIPSAWEASRGGRSVQAALHGVDVAVIVARQIAHATSDQVRKAAARLGVPVEIAETAGVASIRRAIERSRAI